jgi:hypothetical protein
MPTRDIAKGPDVLIITAKKIAAGVESNKPARANEFELVQHIAI